ncbi:hypothetical protein [Desulfallas thermosapovorans]|nr:hypothetical protein [Desulfallas thermosapovorans]
MRLRTSTVTDGYFYHNKNKSEYSYSFRINTLLKRLACDYSLSLS